MAITDCLVPTSLRRALLLCVVALAVGFRLSDTSTPLAQAAVLTVDRLDDNPAASTCSAAIPNDCSLRGAILAANAASVGTTIQVPAGTYVLSQPSSCTFQNRGSPGLATQSQISLCLAKDMTIRGDDAGTTIIDANRNVAPVVFVSAAATVALERLTIRNGAHSLVNTAMRSGGGGINNQGALTLSNMIVRNNAAEVAGGGGIYNSGILTISRSAVEGNAQIENTGAGGGIYNASQALVTMSESAINENSAGNNGGGIWNEQGTFVIANSTISNNTALLFLGGGIFNGGANFIGTLKMTNATVSGNTSGSSGGGLYVHHLSDVHLNNVTIATNTGGTQLRGSGGGIALLNGGLTIRNTIVAGNTDAADTSEDCEARTTATSVKSEGYNLIQNTTNCVITGTTTGNVLNQLARLRPLGNYGGTVLTHALEPDSFAIDAGSPLPPGQSGACAAVDELGVRRPEGDRCDIGAVEDQGGFNVTDVRPARGGNGGIVTLSIFGSEFADDSVVALKGAGPDVVATSVVVAAGGDVLTAVFDLSGRATGPRDVVVTKTGGAAATLPSGFTVDAGGLPDVWVDIVGVPALRVSRPSRFFVHFGNRGTVDALGVTLTLSIPAPLAWNLRFPIAPPPVQPNPDQSRPDDWDRMRIDVVPDVYEAGLSNIPLFLPVVPAGFRGVLELSLTPPLNAPQVEITPFVAVVDDPVFAPSLKSEIVTESAQNARAYVQRVFGETVPASLNPDLEQYVRAQLQATVDQGRAALAASVGTEVPVHSRAWLQLDVSLYALRRTLVSKSALMRLPRIGERIMAAVSGRAVDLWSALLPMPSASAQKQDCPPYKPGEALVPGCRTDSGGDKVGPPPLPAPPGCDPDEIKKQLQSASGIFGFLSSPPNCRLTAEQCEAMPSHYVVRSSGGDFCAPKKTFNKECPAVPLTLPTAGAAQCGIFPLRNVAAQDPNDKTGKVGVGTAHYFRGPTPINYTINFENIPTATAAAQEVVITDVLDATQMDLDTFALGPIAFGNYSVTPAPGVQEYTGGVDLRPAKNLIVLIRAALDKSAATVTWTFTSVDPQTLEFTEDPLAGFLPPNVTPPAGDGSVVFSVQTKGALASGSTLCNDASIVFDVNAPIRTPRWCNVLDESPPSSQVFALPATQSTPTVQLEWTGSDAGSGIAKYTVFVSTNGGPYEALSTTTALSMAFTGVTGNTYAFYTTAVDQLGHLEAPPAAPDAVTHFTGPATGLSVRLNASSYSPGQIMTVTGVLTPIDPPARVDAYIVVQLPTGQYLSLQLGGALVPGIVPIARNFVPFNYEALLAQYTFSGAEPPGVYTWFAVLTRPGTLAFVGPLHQMTFTVGDELARPSR